MILTYHPESMKYNFRQFRSLSYMLALLYGQSEHSNIWSPLAWLARLERRK